MFDAAVSVDLSASTLPSTQEMWPSAFTEKSCAASGASKWNQANEASEFELRVIKAGTSRSSACPQPVSFRFGSTGFGNVCLTPNKSIKTVYHFCSIGSVNTGTLLSSTILAACNCCIMPQEFQGQFFQQASSLLNALFYLGLFANRLPVFWGKCPFRLVKNRWCQCYQLWTAWSCPRLDQLGQWCRLSHSRSESVPCASEVSTLRICLS